MFSYFENRKTTYLDVFCINFSIETKIKTLFLNLSKKRNGTLGTRIQKPSFANILQIGVLKNFANFAKNTCVGVSF